MFDLYGLLKYFLEVTEFFVATEITTEIKNYLYKTGKQYWLKNLNLMNLQKI